jgi:hypothetical protein
VSGGDEFSRIDDCAADSVWTNTRYSPCKNSLPGILRDDPNTGGAGAISLHGASYTSNVDRFPPSRFAPVKSNTTQFPPRPSKQAQLYPTIEKIAYLICCRHEVGRFNRS